MSEVYSSAQLRALDLAAQREGGIPGATLMASAGAAAWRAAKAAWPAARKVLVLAGPGNNGGDGYVLARLALAEGCSVRVQQMGTAPAVGDAADARNQYLAAGGAVEAFAEASLDALDPGSLVVDALFGIGLKRALTGEAASAVRAANRARERGAVLLALDLPSGLDADTGAVLGVAIKADLTVSFIADKLGLHTGAGPEQVGRLRLEGLGVPPELQASQPAAARLLAADQLRAWLPRRGRASHKGSHGHVLIVGGDLGMAGAVLLAARAALRAGAGLVTVATRAAHAVSLVAAQPEVMFHGVETAAELRPLIERAAVVALGPGLGSGAWGRALFAALAEQPGLILDADALNLLAEQPGSVKAGVLTPHPGEAGRLLGMSTAEVQTNRPAAVAALSSRYGSVAVLKGAGSLIHSSSSGLHICPYGNPGMAVAGMGDALTGVIAALLAQGLTAEDAAACGVLVHALAGDAAAAEQGERGLLPSDLIAALRRVVNPC